MKNILSRFTALTILAAFLCLPLHGQVSNVSINTSTKAYASPTASQLAAGNPLFVVTSGTYANPAWVSSLASSKLTGLGTGVPTALTVNIGSDGAPVLFNGAGGTPSSIVLTNSTGTAAGLTAGSVITNANLTGIVTSVGNATAIADGAISLSKLTAGALRYDVAQTLTVENTEQVWVNLHVFDTDEDVANTALGYDALSSVTSGVNNSAYGWYALKLNTAGSWNTAMGFEALETNDSGVYNAAFGYRSLKLSTGAQNSALGTFALPSLTTGDVNTASGYGALGALSAGSGNTAIGSGALSSLATADFCVAIGYQAGAGETESNKFYIDNQSRGSEALARTKALVYGDFNALPGNQQITFNVSTLNVQSGSGGGTVTLSTTNTTATLFNTAATTLNLGGAATTLSIGAATGTATVNNATLAAKAITGTSSITLGANSGTIGSIKLFGSTSGNVTIQPNAVAGTNIVVTAPVTTGTLITTGDTGSVTNAMLAGSIATSKLASATTVGGNIIALTNPSAISFVRIAADNTASTRTPAQVLSDIGAQASGSYAASGANSDITSLSGVTAITGGASNMTITSGTGNSRTLIFRTTTSGGTATTALTLNADQTITLGAGTITGSSGGSLNFGGAGGLNYFNGSITTSSGNFQAGRGQSSFYGFGVNWFTGSSDASFSSPSAGVINVNTGTYDNTLGTLQLANLTASASITASALTASKPVFTNGSKVLVSGAYSVPQIVASADVTAQAATNASIATYTTPNDSTIHSFRVGGYVAITAISAGTLTVQISFTDENNAAQTLTYFGMGLTSSGLTTTGFTGFAPFYIRCKDNTAITFKTSFTGVSITYDAGGTIESLY